MALDQAANFAVDELQSDVTDTATTFSVADASQFPDPANGEYNLVVFDATRPSKDADVEVVRVTGRDTTNDDLTVSRGQETTTATSHASGTAVELSYTAKFRDDIQTELDNAGGVNIIAPQSAVDGEEPTVDDQQEAIAIGNQSNATTSSVAIGHEAETSEKGEVAIGDGAYTQENGVAIGRFAETASLAEYGTAVGQSASANHSNTVAIGRNAVAGGGDSIAIGGRNENIDIVEVRNDGDIAIGAGAQIPFNDGSGYSIAIGAGATADTSEQLVINLGLDNRVLSMDSSGNLTIAGSLTENGTP